MNCPNCGGLLDLTKKKCEYCETTFTDKELGIQKERPSKEESTVENPQEPQEPQRPKTLTEQNLEELRKEKENRPANTDANDILTGATVMSLFNFFPRMRWFFRDLKRTVCLIFLIVLEAIFAFVMISGKITQLLEGELEGFIAVNIVILINALLVGLISRIGYIRAGTAIVAIINFLAVVWTFIYPLIKTDFANQTPQRVAIIAILEMVVIALSVLLCHLVYRRH